MAVGGGISMGVLADDETDNDVFWLVGPKLIVGCAIISFYVDRE